MAYTSEKEYKKKMIITISCVIFAVLLLIALITTLVRFATISKRKSDLQAQLNALTQQIEQNEQSISYYSSDEYIERIAREYLDLQGKDEITFIS